MHVRSGVPQGTVFTLPPCPNTFGRKGVPPTSLGHYSFPNDRKVNEKINWRFSIHEWEGMGNGQMKGAHKLTAVNEESAG